MKFKSFIAFPFATLTGLPAHSLAGTPSWPASGQRFVDTCCESVSRTSAPIRLDIASMQQAGFSYTQHHFRAQQPGWRDVVV